MKKQELVHLIKECYREVLIEAKKGSIDDSGIYIEYDAKKKERILHIPEDMSGEELGAWLKKNKEELNKKYPRK